MPGQNPEDDGELERLEWARAELEAYPKGYRAEALDREIAAMGKLTQEPDGWSPHVEGAAVEHWIDFAQAEHDELWEGVDLDDIPDGFDYTSSAYLGLLLKWLEGIRDRHAAPEGDDV